MDRYTWLRGYCNGLMLPLARMSVELMAVQVDPLNVSVRHQSLHHFMAKAEWCNAEILCRIRQWAVPKMDFARGGCSIIDDTGFPTKGRHVRSAAQNPVAY